LSLDIECVCGNRRVIVPKTADSLQSSGILIHFSLK